MNFLNNMLIETKFILFEKNNFIERFILFLENGKKKYISSEHNLFNEIKKIYESDEEKYLFDTTQYKLYLDHNIHTYHI
jgi:hypothetical protein